MRPEHDNRSLHRTPYFTALQGWDNKLAKRKNDFGVPATILFFLFWEWKSRLESADNNKILPPYGR